MAQPLKVIILLGSTAYLFAQSERLNILVFGIERKRLPEAPNTAHTITLLPRGR